MQLRTLETLFCLVKTANGEVRAEALKDNVCDKCDLVIDGMLAVHS